MDPVGELSSDASVHPSSANERQNRNPAGRMLPVTPKSQPPPQNQCGAARGLFPKENPDSDATSDAAPEYDCAALHGRQNKKARV